MDLQESPFIPTHRHYKGGLYQFLCEVTECTNRDDDSLLRLALYRDSEKRLWVRSWEQFFGLLENGERRFDEITGNTL